MLLEDIVDAVGAFFTRHTDALAVAGLIALGFTIGFILGVNV